MSQSSCHHIKSTFTNLLLVSNHICQFQCLLLSVTGGARNKKRRTPVLSKSTRTASGHWAGILETETALFIKKNSSLGTESQKPTSAQACDRWVWTANKATTSHVRHMNHRDLCFLTLSACWKALGGGFKNTDV